MTWPDRLMFAGSSIMLSLVIKATAVMTLAWIAERACRGCRASVRHIAYVGAFVILLILPLGSLVLPPITVRTTVDGTVSNRDLPVLQDPLQFAATPDTASAVNGARSASSAEVWGLGISIQQALAGVWLVGALVCLVPFGLGIVRGARMKRRAAAWAPGQRLVDDLTSARRIRRRVRVLHAPEANGFFSLGWLHPVVLVPSDAAGWPVDALKRALVHELEHVRRFDYATLLLSRFITTLYWFHPLVWLARRRLELEAEYACDDAVVTGDDPVEYATLLVTAAKLSVVRTPPLLAIASRGELSDRIHAVLDPCRNRGSLSRRSTVSAVALSAVAALMLAPRVALKAEPASHAASQREMRSTGRLSFDAESIKRSRESRPRVAVQGGGYTATGMSLRDLMKAVYLVHPTQLIGGPNWMDSARFDITARTQSPPPGNVVGMKPLVRSLLEDRFGLRTHMETRDLDALVLVRARPGATMLPGLQPSQSKCEGTAEERRAHTRDGWPPCEAMQIVNVPGAGTRGETTSMKVSAYTMDQFAGYVGAILDGPAVNQTGLSGRFDLEFSYVRPLPDASPGDPLPEGPRLARAIEEQLGLRIERRRVSVPVVVIDAVTLPSPD
jgi:uncharacterized protein (TIGR03435 family)